MIDKPSEREEEYFARKEFERKKKLEEALQKKLAEDERRKLKELHYMKCPKCGMALIEIDYKNIRVDKCSDCAGIWLDSGELEAILESEESAVLKIFKLFK